MIMLQDELQAGLLNDSQNVSRLLVLISSNNFHKWTSMGVTSLMTILLRIKIIKMTW